MGRNKVENKNRTVECKLCGKFLKRTSVRTHYQKDDRHFETLVPGQTKLDDLYKECDFSQSFDVVGIKSLIPIGDKTDCPIVQAIYKLKSNFGTQQFSTQVRQLLDERLFRDFVDSAADGKGGARKPKTRQVARQFQGYIKALDDNRNRETMRKIERYECVHAGRELEVCALCQESMHPDEDLSCYFTDQLEPCCFNQVHTRCVEHPNLDRHKCMFCRNSSGVFL